MSSHTPSMWDESVTCHDVKIPKPNEDFRKCSMCKTSKEAKYSKRLEDGTRGVAVRCKDCGHLIEYITDKRRNIWRQFWGEED